MVKVSVEMKVLCQCVATIGRKISYFKDNILVCTISSHDANKEATNYYLA